MNIYTAHYRYSGLDRLDITVKGNTPPGDVLAPTWSMVTDFQAGKIDQWNYTMQYFALLMNRITSIGDGWRNSFDQVTAGFDLRGHVELTLVCFCKPQAFCHRVLAAYLLENMGYGKYLGERVIT